MDEITKELAAAALQMIDDDVSDPQRGHLMKRVKELKQMKALLDGTAASTNLNNNNNNNGVLGATMIPPPPPPPQYMPHDAGADMYHRHQQQQQQQQQAYMYDTTTTTNYNAAAADRCMVPIEPDRAALANLNIQVFDASNDPQWKRSDFPWSQALAASNLGNFGNKNFRFAQQAIINATLADKDVFVLMPTGGGKSLCYQLPAVMAPGVTVVISPLTSLIQDQAAHLEDMGIPAAVLGGNSSMATNANMHTILSGQFKVVFLTPEKLFAGTWAMNVLRRLDELGKLVRVVIDEAHCVSQWGHGTFMFSLSLPPIVGGVTAHLYVHFHTHTQNNHKNKNKLDFRPDYTKLCVFKQTFPHVPVLALTATATRRVQHDITLQLGLSSCLLFRSSFNRPKLDFEVRRGHGKQLEEIANEIVARFSTTLEGTGGVKTPKCGIIYCTTQKKCEQVAAGLEEMLCERLGRQSRQNQPLVAHFHAGMDPSIKERVQSNWSNGYLPIVVATIAFGMGINKPDVRFVYHFNMSKSLEGFVQESGRAGRDGFPASCIMYYNAYDAITLKKMITKGSEDFTSRGGRQDDWQAQIAVNLASVNQITAFCDEQYICRRVMILEHFGEAFHRKDCHDTCDNCRRVVGGRYTLWMSRPWPATRWTW